VAFLNPQDQLFLLVVWSSLPASPHQAMSLQVKPLLGQSSPPAFPCADPAGISEQPVLFFLGRQPGEFRVEGMLGVQEQFLPVQDRGIGALGIVVALDLPGLQVQLDAAQQRRVRIVLEVRVDQLRELLRGCGLSH
jgi:hypothetical protein